MTTEISQAVRASRRALRLEVCSWQRAAAGLLVLSATVNAGLYGLLGREEARHAREVDELRTELRLAERVRDQAVGELGALALDTARERQARAEQAAAKDEAKRLNLNHTVTANMIEDCTITYYCAEKYPHICGLGLGITATGVECDPGHIVAVDPDVIPLHSKVIVDYGGGDLHCYFAEDVGGSVKGNHIDVMCETHADALDAGKTTATVYWIEPEEQK